jgi:hypothetical protein
MCVVDLENGSELTRLGCYSELTRLDDYLPSIFIDHAANSSLRVNQIGHINATLGNFPHFASGFPLLPILRIETNIDKVLEDLRD